MYKNINSGEVIEDKEYLAMVKAEAEEEFNDNKKDYLAEGVVSAKQLYAKWLSEPDGDFQFIDDNEN